jgi:MFS family permease
MQTFDDALEKVGGFGRFQIAAAIAAQLNVISFTANYVLMTFVNQPLLWECPITNGNHTLEEQCALIDRCPAENLTVRNVENSDEFRSFVADWHLVCDLEWIPNFLTTIQMLGTLAGGQLAGYFSDSFGRKIVFVSSYALLAITGFASIFCSDWRQMAVARFFIGAFMYGAFVTNFVWLMEMTHAKWNLVANIATSWQGGYMTSALLAYITKDWRDFSIVANIFPCILVPVLWLH